MEPKLNQPGPDDEDSPISEGRSTRPGSRFSSGLGLVTRPAPPVASRRDSSGVDSSLRYPPACTDRLLRAWIGSVFFFLVSAFTGQAGLLTMLPVVSGGGRSRVGGITRGGRSW